MERTQFWPTSVDCPRAKSMKRIRSPHEPERMMSFVLPQNRRNEPKPKREPDGQQPELDAKSMKRTQLRRRTSPVLQPWLEHFTVGLLAHARTASIGYEPEAPASESRR